MSADVLSLRALNRATLARQLLLRRSAMAPLAAVEHLVGMQAQLPLNPYLGLWSRLEAFDPETLGNLVLDRSVVRVPVMRSTIHLVTAVDCLSLRALAQPVLDRELERHREYAPKLRGVDVDAVIDFAGPLLGLPHTLAQLRAALKARFPDHDPAALAFLCRNRLTLVQVPPRGVWGRTAPITVATAESWTGRARPLDPSIDEVALRYLAAFGPAAVVDVAAWSGLTGLREVLERLRPRLRTFRDPKGRELFDLPDAPRPDPDTPAPVRFLPEYDNGLLSHADRSRFGFEAVAAAWISPPVQGTSLHDGRIFGTWSIERERDAGRSTLVVRPVEQPTKAATAEVEAEGLALLGLLEPAAETRDVRFLGPT